jgi:hypothetical protein
LRNKACNPAPAFLDEGIRGRISQTPRKPVTPVKTRTKKVKEGIKMPHENLTPRPQSTPGPFPARRAEKQIPNSHTVKNDFLKCTKTENSRRRHENWGINKASLGFILLACSSLLNPPAFGQAVSISGPGGTGTTGPESDPQAAVLDTILTYTSVNYIDVTVPFPEIGLLAVNFGGSFGVTNDTGQTWTGFTLDLPPNFGENSAEATFSQEWGDASGEFTTVEVGLFEVFFSGGSILPGSSFDPVGVIEPQENGSFTLVETPYAVPEPSIGGLLLFGLLGAVSGRRFRSQSRRSGANARQVLQGPRRWSSFGPV